MSFPASISRKLLSVAITLMFGRYLISRVLSTRKEEAKPEKWPAEEFYWLKCPSGNIIYVEFDGVEGTQPLVFIHGLNANRYQWFYQRAYFRKRHTLVFIDIPGHGRSAMPKDLSIPALAGDLKYILNYFKLKDSIIYGHSMGGWMTLEYSISEEQKPAGIIIQHSTYTNPIKTVQFSRFLLPLQNLVLVPFFELSKKLSLLLWASSWVSHLNGITSAFFRYIFFTGGQTSAQLRFMSRLSAGVPPWVVAEAILRMMEYDISDKLSRVDVPALIIGARQDRVTKLKASKFIHTQIPGSELVVINEGHLSLVENHGEVNKVVDRFILHRE